MVPAASDRIPRVPPYSGNALNTAPLPVRASHPLRTDFPDGSGSWLQLYGRSYYPAVALTTAVWAPPLSLATTQGIDSFFLLLQVLRCFSSLRSPRLRSRCTAFGRAGSPIRTPTDHFPFADPRGFSQLTASFLASGSLGIPRSPFSSFSRLELFFESLFLV